MYVIPKPLYTIIQKEENSLNPKLGKTEKSPLLEPISKDKNFSKQEGSNLKPKESIREKIDRYKNTIKKKQEKSSEKLPKRKQNIKRNIKKDSKER